MNRFDEKLEIIIITYNRERYLKRTLDALLDQDSPVKDVTITVLDNNSSDGTALTVANYEKSKPNVRYIKNKYNLGISGNIFRAMEIAEKDYVWILGDDDAYDFSGWSDVDAAMSRGEKVICVARYSLPDSLRDDVAAQLVQITFITGCIYSTKLFHDTSMRDSMYNVFNLFPHLMPVVQFINNGGKIYVAKDAISDNGLLLGEDKDCSYNRGVAKASVLSPRVRNMTWIVGWASVCQALADKTLQKRTMMRGITCIHLSGIKFVRAMFAAYHDSSNEMLLSEVYPVLPFRYRLILRLLFFAPFRCCLTAIRSVRVKIAVARRKK